VRVTIFPVMVCLPTTVNPSLTSTCRALAKVRPTTSGIVIMGGVLEADALGVGLAVWVLARDAEGELAEDADRELAGAGEG
jgi:hypothetical protein